MANFKIWEVKNGYLLNPTGKNTINRVETIIKAKSRLDSLKMYSENSSKIYFKGNQPYYNPFYNVKYIALLHKK